MGRDRSIVALGGIVFVHLAVTLAHAWAHVGAAVYPGPGALAFIVVVIQLGPPAGLALMLANPRAGARVVALTMTAALVFGLVNHFLIPGVDHVAHVGGPWRLWFGTTAALLAITEAAGAMFAMVYGWRPERRIA
jgi:hypothetical protein